MSQRGFEILVFSAALAGACGGQPCRAQSDCQIGSYCQVAVSDTDVDGVCAQDCVVNEDCGEDESRLTVSTCNNEGRCLKTARPPRLQVLQPENDSLLAEGTRTVQISGEVETANEKVTVTVAPQPRNSCSVGISRSVVLENNEIGRLVRLPFVVDGIELDPGLNSIVVRAQVGAARKQVNHIVEIPCPGCAEIAIDEPDAEITAPGLVLPRLAGTISPATVASAIWRVRGEGGDVFDGPALVSNGRFEATGLPLFGGFNRVEVIVSGVGSGLGENRCSRAVSSGVVGEKGLRAVLSWDGRTSDLDVHVVGPGGLFGDPSGELSSRNKNPGFGGTIEDDFDGLGPEVAAIETPADGTYGIIVEPVFDDRDRGSNAVVRVLFAGRPVVRGALGPTYLTDVPGDLWIVGKLEVEGETSAWTSLDDQLPASAPPTRPPSDWPEYY